MVLAKRYVVRRGAPRTCESEGVECFEMMLCRHFFIGAIQSCSASTGLERRARSELESGMGKRGYSPGPPNNGK